MNSAPTGRDHGHFCINSPAWDDGPGSLFDHLGLTGLAPWTRVPPGRVHSTLGAWDVGALTDNLRPTRVEPQL